MKKIGVVALVLVLVAMTMGCGSTSGGLNGTWKGEHTQSDALGTFTTKITLKLDDPLFEMTEQSVSVKDGVSYEDDPKISKGTYTYDKKSKLITLTTDEHFIIYGDVDGKEMSIYGVTLKKQ